MIQFFQTLMGKKFFEGDIPRISKSLEAISLQGAVVLTKEIPEIRTSLARIADALEQANQLKAKELEEQHIR